MFILAEMPNQRQSLLLSSFLLSKLDKISSTGLPDFNLPMCLKKKKDPQKSSGLKTVLQIGNWEGKAGLSNEQATVVTH